jgi:DNA-binding SARP family transcriptional activator
MATLRILLFGGIQVSHEGTHTATVELPRSARLLFSYLLLQPSRAIPREVLAGLVWGDRPDEQARSCLNTALWRLRRALEPEDVVTKGAYLRTTPSGDVGFNWQSDHWLDLAAFETQAVCMSSLGNRETTAEDVRGMEQVLPFYTGDLLEGFYEEWVLAERERLRAVYLNCLSRLMRYYRQQGAYERALHYGYMLLRNDPLREEVHRDVMRLYVASGQRAQALRQYEVCRSTLDAELGISPMAETERLHAQIIALNGTPAAAPDPSELSLYPSISIAPTASVMPAIAPSANLSNALEQLKCAIGAFDAARAELQQAIQLVEYLAPATAA